MIRILLTTAFAVLLATGAQAGAAKKPKKAPPIASTVLEERFKKLDADSDGKLSLAEFKKIEEMIPKPMVAKVKKAKKAKPTVSESPIDLEKVFKLLDKNSDGSLNEEEFKTLGFLASLGQADAPAKKKK